MSFARTAAICAIAACISCSNNPDEPSSASKKAAAKKAAAKKVATADKTATAGKTGGASKPKGCLAVLNGKPTSNYSYVLKMTSPSVCTVSLLSPTTLLTAAHCIPRGLTSLAVDGLGTLQVESITTRDFFAEDAAALLSNKDNIGRDIALLKLAQPITSRPYAKLYFGPLATGDAVEIAGYGLSQTSSAAGVVSPAGGPSEMLLVAPNKLFASIDPALIVVLAKDDVQNGISMPGDSGGPLLRNDAILGVMHKGSSNFAMGGLSSVVPTTPEMLDRLSAAPPQFFAVWASLQDPGVRAFLADAKAAGYSWDAVGEATDDGSVAPSVPGVAPAAADAAPSAPGAMPQTGATAGVPAATAAGASDCDIVTTPAAAAPPSAATPAPVAAAEVDKPGSETVAAPSPPVVSTTPTAGSLDQATVQSYVAKMNAVRAQPTTCGGVAAPAVPALTWDEKLYQAALRHSIDLESKGIAGHQGSDGSMPNDRIAAAGYLFRTAGENQASGFFDLESVYAAWQSSPGHCANNMANYYTQFGLAAKNGVWTLVFATPQ